MRSRVRTGSRPEVTIWILGPLEKYPSGYFRRQVTAGRVIGRARVRDGGERAASWRRGAGRAAVARGATPGGAGRPARRSAQCLVARPLRFTELQRFLGISAGLA